MRVLLSDVARGATVTSLYETNSYPAQNIVDVFLDRIFVSALPSDTITVDLGAEVSVDTVFIAGTNATSALVELLNASSVVVHSETVDTTRDVSSAYFTAVSARYVKLTLSVASGYLTVKGFGCGVSEVFESISADLVPVVSNDTSYTRSRTGQVLRNATPSFFSYDLTAPLLTIVELKELQAKLSTIGPYWPTYWDMAEETSDFHDPIYGVINGPWSVAKTNNRYNLTMNVLEAR